MFLTRWLAKTTRTTPPRPATPPAFRPGLEALGERIAPHASWFLHNGPPPFLAPWAWVGSSENGSGEEAATAEFAVIARREAFAGSETRITVVALDENGRPDRDYTGTVALTSSDPDAVLPEDYTFTADDRGRHTFVVTLATEGNQTVTATDTADAAVTGSTTVNVDPAQVADHFFVRTERDVFSGSVTRVVVAALDESNRPVRDYAGTVTLTSSDPDTVLPEDYTFTEEDRGVHVFEFTPAATGDLTLTATDTANAALTGSVTVDVDEAPVATSFAVIARPRSVAGDSFRLFVVALDDSNRLVRDYTGTVTLTSSDPGADLPTDVTFTEDDRGVKMLTATLSTEGDQTLTVTDAANADLTGTITIDVGTADAFHGGFGFHLGGFTGRGRGR
jgi:hypothetical protein